MRAQDIVFRSWNDLNSIGIYEQDFNSGGEQAAHAIRTLLSMVGIVFMHLAVDGIVGYYND